jgi:hypothetical protein
MVMLMMMVHALRDVNLLQQVRAIRLRYSYTDSLLVITTLLILGCCLFYNLAVTFDASSTGLATNFTVSFFAFAGSLSGNAV